MAGEKGKLYLAGLVRVWRTLTEIYFIKDNVSNKTKIFKKLHKIL